jgi:hypothetical protein
MLQEEFVVHVLRRLREGLEDGESLGEVRNGFGVGRALPGPLGTAQ